MTAVAHPAEQRLAINRLGMWLFVVSEGFLFLILIATRFLLLGTAQPPEVSLALGALLTAVLLSSSATAYLADRSVIRGRRSLFLWSTIATMVLGLVFLGLVGVEWGAALVHFPPSTLYGSVFFTLTGTHALHLLSGLVVLLAVYLNGKRGRFSPEDHWGVRGGVLYWHFVDAVWLSVFATLYLVG